VTRERVVGGRETPQVVASQSDMHGAVTEDVTLSTWLRGWSAGWNEFWFAPSLPHALAVIRIGCGGMLAYVHLIWAIFARDFMGRDAWLDLNTIRRLHADDWTWSWLYYTDSLGVIVAHEVIAMVAGLAMMVGLATRISIPLAWWMTLMVCHRMTGALFGLDQIVMMLSMYLMLSNCGSVWSVDAWLRERKRQSWWLPTAEPAISNNLATRLIQLHLCAIYLFGGLSKLRGEMWWDGSALWYAVVNYEYQSLDLTWLGNMRFVIAALTTGTVIWETFYCALVWPRLTRPLVLAMALFVHGGIAIGLGMITFGTIMMLANLSFIQPAVVQRLIERFRPTA
jgi:hypothetical protein